MSELLAISLQAAVPLWIAQVRARGESAWADRLSAKADEWSRMIASRADNLMYRGGKPGEATDLFNTLAEALAHMAFVPGGVKVFGCHWEARFDG